MRHGQQVHEGAEAVGRRRGRSRRSGTPRSSSPGRTAGRSSGGWRRGPCGRRSPGCAPAPPPASRSSPRSPPMKRVAMPTAPRKYFIPSVMVAEGLGLLDGVPDVGGLLVAGVEVVEPAQRPRAARRLQSSWSLERARAPPAGGPRSRGRDGGLFGQVPQDGAEGDEDLARCRARRSSSPAPCAPSPRRRCRGSRRCGSSRPSPAGRRRAASSRRCPGRPPAAPAASSSQFG